jgi:hypothetical protein
LSTHVEYVGVEFSMASLLVLFSILLGLALGGVGLWQFWANRATRKRGLLLMLAGAVLQSWWVFFLVMDLYKTFVLKQDT